MGTRKFKFKKTLGVLLASTAVMVMIPISASAHCDTMDGPTVIDGQKAMENNNVNYVLKWVQPEDEKEVKEKFELSMKVKDLSPEAKELSEQYFFSELVRLHRAAEGAPFDGLKPTGTPVDEKVVAADKSIEAGNLSALKGLIEEEKMPELEKRFEKVMELKDYDVNNLEEGREYIEAYVKFFKFAEGEEDHAHGAHGEETAHNPAVDHDAEANHESKTDHEKAEAKEKTVPEEGVTPAKNTYTVQPGDTLWKIAKKFNTTHHEIQHMNNIKNPNRIYPGQTFVVPGK